MVAYRESAELAKRLIEESCKKQLIQPGQLTLHADRGVDEIKPVALLLADLGVASRPHVSDDNPPFRKSVPHSEYRPEFPDRAQCIRTVVLSVRVFVGTPNTVTPA
jgi:putative transposase